MEYFGAVLTVAVVHFLTLVSPGPDFAMVSRNSLIYSQRTGVYSAVGLGLGHSVHAGYSALGLGIALAASDRLYSGIQLVGAGYLAIVGLKSLMSSKWEQREEDSARLTEPSRLSAFRMGLVTALLNAKVIIIYLSLFVVVTDGDSPLALRLSLVSQIGLGTFVWFALVAYLFSHHLVKKRLSKVEHYLEEVMGVVLIALAAEIVWSVVA